MQQFPVQLSLAAALAWSAFGHVLAQSEAAGSVSYEETIRHAVDAYSLGHWTEARFFFARAHAQHPNARTLRGLGLTCYESRDYVEAIGFFKRALASTEQPLTESMREDIARFLEQSQQRVTRVEVTLEPPAATLEVDHVERDLNGGGVVLLDPGEHELAAEAQGYEPQRRRVTAEGGEQRIELRLRPRETPRLHAQETAAPQPKQAASSHSELAPYIVIGASGASLIVGAALVGIAASDKYAVENAAQGSTWPQLEPRYNRGRTFFPVGFALMGVGLAGVAAGLTWKLWPADRALEQRVHLRLSGAGIELSGRF